MNKIYTTTVALLAAMMFFAACGNAGAQNDKKTDNAPKAVKELETLTKETVTEAIYAVNKNPSAVMGRTLKQVAEKLQKIVVFPPFFS